MSSGSFSQRVQRRLVKGPLPAPAVDNDKQSAPLGARDRGGMQLTDRQTLSSRGADQQKRELSEFVGKTLAIRLVSFGTSFRYSAGYVELTADVMTDVNSGEVEEASVFIVSFGKAVVRTLGVFVGGDDYEPVIDPPLVVRVEQQGDTHVLVDIE